VAVRHNTCLNPALKSDATGWGGNSTPTRTDVTGEGFSRQYAARYTSGTFTRSAPGAASPGLAYTLSVYVWMDSAFAHVTGTIYVEWRKANDDIIQYDSTGYDVPGRVVSRISVTATAPALTAKAHIITDGVNFASSPSDFTMVLIEQAASLDSYFDGDTTPGGSWDGADGNSASTLTDLQQEAGETALVTGPVLTVAGMKHVTRSCVLAGGVVLQPARGDPGDADITVRLAAGQHRTWSARTSRAWSGRTGDT
jgi:hypothetical protein